MGCNSKCAYCIVPAVRGREQSRRPGEIIAEVEALARDGVREITLLGQNVNSWGRDLAPDIRTEFGELLRACDAVGGIERIRFTSPHPKDFREPVIAAMAECRSVCEHVHLPLQSGSARVLKAMRRTYTRERFVDLAARLRDAIPDLALGTDIIVGFPGETEADFAETLEVVQEVGFESAFTFVYSPRARHGGRLDGRPGSGGREARAHGAARRGRPARRVGPQRQRGSAASTRCSSRARAGPIRRFSAAVLDGTRRSTSPARRKPAISSPVEIESATSTTLRGRERVPRGRVKPPRVERSARTCRDDVTHPSRVRR